MPYPKLPNNKELTNCPECGQDLDGYDPIGHAKDHWADMLNDKDPTVLQARTRQALLLSARESKE